MSAQEFGEWITYFQSEQLHPRATWQRHAQLLAAAHNGPLTRKDGALWSPADLTPADPWAPLPPETAPAPNAAAQAAQLAAQVAAINQQQFDD